MIPVYVQGKCVGRLPPIAVRPLQGHITFALMPLSMRDIWKMPPEQAAMPPVIEQITLEIRDKQRNGCPGELHAPGYRGLLSLKGFEPEHWALPELTKADSRRA